MSSKCFNIGDLVRDIRFNVPFYGRVIAIDRTRERLVVQRDDGRNFGVHMDMMQKI